MLRSRIIPCLLIQDGGLVKTRGFKDPKYVGDPINAVKIFNEKEVDELVIYDITATAKKRTPNFSLLKHIAAESRMPLCYGGGITTEDQAVEIISSGYEKISLSSAALNDPTLIQRIAKRIGSQSVAVTLDVRKNKLLSGYTIFTENGTKKQKLDLVEFCKMAAELGAGELVINSIDRDGEMSGYDLNLAKYIREVIDVPLSIVGGAGSPQHMKELIETVGTVGAVAGSMFVFKGQFRAVLISYTRP